MRGPIVLREVDLGRKTSDVLQLERMQVWAEDAKIVVYDAAGQAAILAPPTVQYFKGRVVGEDDSAVFFSMSADGRIRGMVIAGERKWNIGSGVRKIERSRLPDGDAFAPVLIGEIDTIDELTDRAADWECHVDRHATASLKVDRSALTASATRRPIGEVGNVAGASYRLRIAVETDNELCAAFGNNATSITEYIGDLFGKASVVYERDLNTTLTLGQINIRNGGAGSDPWTTTVGQGTAAALAEFGTYWHSNYPMSSVPRSSAVFLSGRLFSAGIAWSYNALCTDDFYCGATGSSCGSSTFANAYAGAYAFNGSAGSVETSVPNPEATVGGVVYGLPSSNYWMLLEVMHELGHNAEGPHTQCVALTAQEKIDYATSRSYVDECYNRDGAGCYSSTTANCDLNNPGDPYCDAPPEKGTIMSYCHNIVASGQRQSRFLFGKAGEPSFKMLGLFRTSLEEATPNPMITAQTQPVACSSDRTASVASCSGCTYQWSITGGTITSSTTFSSITYTPSSSSVALKVTVSSERGCGITASKTIATNCGAVSPPASVMATATSTSNVLVTWTAAANATSYNVYRSSNGISYSLAGSSATTSFNDSGRTANTSYLYKVRSVSGGESSDSSIDVATTVIFTDDPLLPGSTLSKTVHLTELRTAVNAIRALASLGAGTYTDPTVTSGVTIVKGLHIVELRNALDAACAALALPAMSYGEPITASVTAIRAAHFTELRNGVK